MAYFLFFIALIFIILFLAKLGRLEARISSLERLVKILAGQAKIRIPEGSEYGEEPITQKPAQADTIPSPFQEQKIEEMKPTPPPTPVDFATTSSLPEGDEKIAPVPKMQEARVVIMDKELWKKIETKFVENWTGIIGALVMVMGVAFLGIYAALALNPFHRFLMITGFGVGLGILSFIMKSKEKWANLAVWIRSSAGAILLFACLGSGWIAGLKWVDDSRGALAFLIVGIALNVFLGLIAGKQVFASFHTIISLIALGIAPQSHVTLIISTIVILFGISFSYRSRWEHHLILTISASLIYHFHWYTSMGFEGASNIPLMLRMTGISAVASIGISACFIHYRRIYSSRKFDLFPFLGHMMNWAYMVLGFLLYSTGSKWNTLVLSGGAIAAFVIAQRARTLDIRWLYNADTMIAQAIALYALFTLGRWGFDYPSITAAIYVEVLVFALAMMKQNEVILHRVAIYLHLLSVPVVIMVAANLLDLENAGLVAKNSSILAGIIGLQTAFHIFLKKSPAQDLLLPERGKIWNEVSLSGIFIGLLATLLFVHLHRYPWSGYLIAGLGSFLFYMRQRFQSVGMGIGLLLFLFSTHAVAWFHMGSDLQRGDSASIAIYALPLFILSLAFIRWSFLDFLQKFLRWPGIYIFSAHLIYSTYLISNHVSPFLPGIYWLVLSVIYLEAAIFISKRLSTDSERGGAPERHLLHVGYFLIGLFISRHVMVHMQSEMYIGGIKIRLLIELFALIIFFYWALAKVSGGLQQYKVWRHWHPFLGELIVASSAFIVALEVPSKWHPAAWVLMAFGLSLLGNYLPKTPSRLRFYSLLFYWAAAFHVAFLSWMEVTPSMRWIDQTWFAAILAVILQLVFIIYFYKKESLAGIEFPRPILFLRNSVKKVQTSRHLWVFYPFFAAVALFFYGSFDRSFLTLLWVFEAFAIFALSLILRESHFRYLSMAWLAGCLLRLVFYDLSRSPTLTRAIVFIGVGILMLVMNSLYNRYKERF